MKPRIGTKVKIPITITRVHRLPVLDEAGETIDIEDADVEINVIVTGTIQGDDPDSGIYRKWGEIDDVFDISGVGYDLTDAERDRVDALAMEDTREWERE